MQKDFDRWNDIKKSTQEGLSRLYTVREIWWCALGINIGSEIDGKGEKFLRPCVIMRAFGSDACLVIPLTTSSREHAMRVPIGKVQGEDAKANISQIRIIDTRRLVEKVGFLDEPAFQELKKRVKTLF
ncbi:MAG: type II toxin-antitoxin system PemK/MazF family toxin [Minisyncoccota bacterium]